MRVAVIGLGAMGHNHERVLTELGQDVATVDPAGHADHERIADAAPFDAACIATSPAQLFDATLQAAEWTERLLIEKPLAPTLSQASTLAVRLPDAWVGYVERFNPMLPVVQELLPTLGEVRTVKVTRLGMEQRNDLGAYRDLATHDLDLLDALAIPLDRCEVEVGYQRSAKLRIWEVQCSEHTLTVDWQAQTCSTTEGETVEAVAGSTEPLTKQWRAFLDGAAAPVDTRAAVQLLRTAIQLEQEHSPIAA